MFESDVLRLTRFWIPRLASEFLVLTALLIGRESHRVVAANENVALDEKSNKACSVCVLFKL